MKFLFIVLLSSMTFCCQSQTSASIDSLITQACNSLETSTGLSDSAKFSFIMQQFIYPYISVQVESKRDSIGEYIHLRFQKLCTGYYQLLGRLFKLNEDWEKVDTKIPTALSKAACRSLIELRNFYYLEENGDTTRLTIDGKYWTETFKDGTYSKLKFKWVSDCEFQIELIESTNPKRNAVVNKKEVVDYVVLDKYPNRYKLLLVFSEKNEYWVTYIYY